MGRRGHCRPFVSQSPVMHSMRRWTNFLPRLNGQPMTGSAGDEGDHRRGCFGCAAGGDGDEDGACGQDVTTLASRPGCDQGRAGSAAALMRTATGRDPLAFITTAVPLPLLAGQVRVCRARRLADPGSRPLPVHVRRAAGHRIAGAGTPGAQIDAAVCRRVALARSAAAPTPNSPASTAKQRAGDPGHGPPCATAGQAAGRGELSVVMAIPLIRRASARRRLGPAW